MRGLIEMLYEIAVVFIVMALMTVFFVSLIHTFAFIGA